MSKFRGEGGKKKSLILLVAILALFSVTAYAASAISQRFVVRNWKAAVEELDPEEQGEVDQDEAEEQAAPVDDHSEEIELEGEGEACVNIGWSEG